MFICYFCQRMRVLALAWSTTWTTEGPQATMSPCRMFALVPMPWSCRAGGAGTGQRVRGRLGATGARHKGRRGDRG